MAVAFVTPAIPKPFRVLFMGAVVQGWLEATGEERRDKVLPRMKQMMLEEWPSLGAKVVATFDDDLFMVGPPSTPDFTWYLLFEVPSMEAVAGMINRVRTEVDGVRLDKYVRLEARFGRKFFLLEGGAH